ncbi:hypothetical protein, partial [Pelagicoccus sp. SDUM812002]|uniref:hypothetical protein n=1 Tax=Pelagicoccus sp. SDUM812002 TaxID=3041266 RepID=UPI0028104EFA
CGSVFSKSANKVNGKAKKFDHKVVSGLIGHPLTSAVHRYEAARLLHLFTNTQVISPKLQNYQIRRS